METQVGNPNVSLLPQPSQPVPIEPMRGGSVGFSGGASENVSLLPQPATPAPIEPMRGGASENVSLLPQPSVPLEIVPMKGGDREIFLLKSKPFYGLEKVKPDIPPPRDLTVEDAEKYVKYRTGNPWTPIPEKPSDMILEYNKEIDDKTIVFLYHISSFEEYLRVDKVIRNNLDRKKRDPKHDNHYIIILLFQEPEKTIEFEIKKIFNEIYRTFIHYVPDLQERYGSADSGRADDFEIYLLYRKKNLRITWKPRPKGVKDPGYNETSAPSSLKYLEPDIICLKYKSGEETRELCIEAPGTKAKAVEKEDVPRSIITSQQLGATTEIIPPVGKDIGTLGRGRFFIQQNWPTHYLLLEHKDNEFTEAPKKPVEPVVAPGKTETPTPPPPPPPPPSKKEVPAPAKVKRIFELKDVTDTVPIDLGDKVYRIRKYDEATLEAWRSSIFSEGEKELFQEIGIDEEFIKKSKEVSTDDLGEKRKAIVAGRGKLLEILTTTTCLNTASYLLRSECEYMREYLQDLFFIRQMDRLQAITSQLSGIDDFMVDLSKIKEEKASKELVMAGIDFVDTFLARLGALEKKTKKRVSEEIPLLKDLIGELEILPGILERAKEKAENLTIHTAIPKAIIKGKTKKDADMAYIRGIIAGVTPSRLSTQTKAVKARESMDAYRSSAIKPKTGAKKG